MAPRKDLYLICLLLGSLTLLATTRCAAAAAAASVIVESCRSHPDWSAVFHPYVNLPEQAYLLRIAEWNSFCATLSNDTVLTSMTPGQLANAWSDFTPFLPLASCTHRFRPRSATSSSADATENGGEELTITRLCVDLSQLGVTIFALAWIALQYYFPDRYGPRRRRTTDGVFEMHQRAHGFALHGSNSGS